LHDLSVDVKSSKSWVFSDSSLKFSI
jgi:hypothetical protein